MNASDAQIFIGKQPKAVSLALAKFGYKKPRPTLNDVVNAFILHEKPFAEELALQLGFDGFDLGDISSVLDDVVKYTKGVSVVGAKINEGINPNASTNTQGNPANKPTILGINQTLFIALIAAILLVVLVLAYK